jgi:ornithine cyclodeaminase/alanine dehydrogenase-like protein (mu-crystallin family)
MAGISPAMTVIGVLNVPIYIKEADVAEFLDMPSCLQALRDIFAAEAKGQANTVPRTRWPFGPVRLNVMGGGERPSKRFNVKSYGGGAFHVLLYAEDKGLLAVIEANTLGQIRTGAASGIATEKMAKPGAGKVGLIGAGRQARTQVLALKAVGMLSELAVYARNRENLVAFCFNLAEELGGAQVRAAESAEDAVRGADIVVTATGSSEPVLKHAWLSPGAHVNAMGANAANRREIDEDCVLKASLVVTDHIEQAKTEAAEFIDLAKAGRFDWSKVRTLQEIVAGPRIAREPNAITLFKSLGVGLEDVAAASVVYDRAVASGRFKPL